MFLKTILWGFFLFGIVFLGNETRQRYLKAKLDAEHLQNSPLSIHKSGTILKFTAEAEFELPLGPALQLASENGYSHALFRYLAYQQQKVVPYWETPRELRFELDLLIEQLIRDRVFSVRNPITDKRYTSFRILPENEDYYFAYAYEDGTPFYKEEKYNFNFSCGLSNLVYLDYTEPVLESSYQAMFTCEHIPEAPPLVMTLEHAVPDLALDRIEEWILPQPTNF